jgi:hypothetical protein
MNRAQHFNTEACGAFRSIYAQFKWKADNEGDRAAAGKMLGVTGRYIAQCLNGEASPSAALLKLFQECADAYAPPRRGPLDGASFNGTRF